MLKLEINSKTHDISVRLHQEEASLNSIFLTALGIAISIHLIAFFMFHIELFKIAPTTFFVPVDVQMIQNSSTALVNNTNIDALLDGIVPPPPKIIASFPDIPLVTWGEELTPFNSPIMPLADNSFYLLHQSSPFLLVFPSARIYLSGKLSSKKIIYADNDILERFFIKHGPLASTRVHYFVRLNEKTGQIFWYERQSSSFNEEINQLAEKILVSLQFELDPKRIDVSGEITFIFQNP